MQNYIRYDKGIVAIAVCCFLSLILPYHVHPYRAFYNELLPIFGVAVAVAFCIEQRVISWSIPKSALLPILVSIIIAIQAASGMFVSAADALIPIAYLWMTSLAICLGATLATQRDGHERLIHDLALAFLLAALVSVCIATLQFIGEEGRLGSLAMQMPHQAGQNVRPYANTGQPNQLALFFCVAIAAVWWFYQVRKIGMGAAAGLTVTLLWGLALTQSRIGWLIIPTYAVLMYRWRRVAHFRRLSIISILALPITYSALIAALPKIAQLLKVSASSAVERVQTGAERISLFEQAWAISWQHPWQGAGWFQFGPQQLHVALEFQQSIYAEHSHNIVLNLAAELGWPVAITVIAAVGAWFIASWRSPIKTKGVAFSTLLFWAAGIHSMLEFPLWYAYVLIPIALLIGSAHQTQFGSRQIAIPRTVIAFIFVLMAAGMVAIATDYRRLVISFRALGFENLGLTPDEGSTKKPEFTMFPQFYEYFSFTKNQAHAGMTPDEIAKMEHSASRFGYAPVVMRMSLVYVLNGREDDAVKAMSIILKLHPSHYSEAYASWKKLSVDQPAIYAAAFRRFTPPISNSSLQKKIGG